MHLPTLPRRPQHRAAVAVLLGHGLLVLGLLQATRPEHTAPAATNPATIWLRWISAPTRPPAAAKPAPERRAAERPIPQAPVKPPLGVAITITPAAPAPAPAPALAPAPPPAPLSQATPAGPTPLDLQWRRPRAAASAPPTAGDLARSETRLPPRPAHEDQLARALGTDTTLHEDVLDGGKRRFRSGSGCVETRPTRAAQLDPFNQSVRPTPQLAEGCR